MAKRPPKYEILFLVYVLGRNHARSDGSNHFGKRLLIDFHFDRPAAMSQLGQERRLRHPAATSDITLNADICLRCNI
jgi:hypothetical protein